MSEHQVTAAPVLLGPRRPAPVEEVLLRCATRRCGWRRLVPAEQADAVTAAHLDDPDAP